MMDIRIAWWNLENLFDHETASRDPALARELKNELKGWTAAIRDRKLDQLSAIIKLMFDGAGPDLLGVCEVENERVLGMLAKRLTLPGRNYQVLTHPSPDVRGIDVSFIVDENVLTPSDPNHLTVIKRIPTRDIFWATMTVKATGASFMVIANHWPARSQGQYESEPFRMLVGETVSVILSRSLSATDGDPDRPILLMGDFNDEPFNRSMQEYLLGTRDIRQVTRGRSPRLLNLMWPLMTLDPPGSFRFGTTWNMLDQFLASKGLLTSDSPVRIQRQSVAIFCPEVIRGPGGAPRRFGRPATSLDQDGYSDHFPITAVLRVK